LVDAFQHQKAAIGMLQIQMNGQIVFLFVSMIQPGQ